MAVNLGSVWWGQRSFFIAFFPFCKLINKSMRYFLIKKLKLLQVVMQKCYKAQWYSSSSLWS